MKERFALLLAYFKDKFAVGKKSGKEKRKNLILSIVALVEVLAIAVVSVSAWVETISTVKFEITEGKIDDYVFTDATIGTGSGYDGNSIDLTKYFNEAGGAHLASATSANGRDIYFPNMTSDGAPSGTYRSATINDKNVNYVDFSFYITANGTDASFYFEKVPSIKVNDTSVSENKVRVSFLCNGNNAVVCAAENSNETVVSGESSLTKSQENVKSFNSYVGISAANPLFTVLEGQREKVTMRVWLQDDSRDTVYAGQFVTIDNFKLVTQNQQTKEITFSDKTTGDPSLGIGWATQNNRNIWVHQSGKSEYKKLTKNSNGDFSIELGKAYTDYPNNTLTFYSCESTVTSNPQNSYVAKWTTTLQASQVYTAYGYQDSSKNGYGTWNDVQKILLSSEDADTLPMEQVGGKYLAVNMYMDGNSNPIAMTFDPNKTASLKGWVAYMPDPNSASSKTLRFSFTYNNKSYNISAPSRGTSVNFVVTSASTGYWAPPATVSVYSQCLDGNDGNAQMGTVSVSGGKAGATSVKVTAGTQVTLTATPKSDKYNFQGWYSDPEFTNQITLKDKKITATDTTKEYKFYAKFVRQYTIVGTAVTGASVEDSTGGTVKMEGVSGSKVSHTFLEGQSTTLTATAKKGYDFVGWFTDEACTKSYTKDTEISFDGIKENHSYYAQFKIKTFTVKAVARQADGADVGTVEFTAPKAVAPGTSVTVTVDYGGSATFVAKPSKDGYKFVMWTDAVGNPIDLNSEYVRNNIINDTTLYAKFELIDLDLKVYPVLDGKINENVGTLNLGSGSAVSKIETTIKWGSTVTLKATAKDLGSTVYDFEGWYTDRSCTKKADSSILNNCVYTSKVIDTKAIKSNLTLYAKFINVTPYTVTAKAVYGNSVGTDSTAGTVQAGAADAGAVSKTSVKHSISVSLKAALTDDKMYTFAGWYTDSACSKKADSSVLKSGVYSDKEVEVGPVTKDVELYAKFIKTTFEIRAVAVDAHGTVEFTAPKAVAPDTSVKVTVEYNGSATFLATPSASEGYKFVGWYDTSNNRVSTSAEYTVSNIKTGFTLNAKFELMKYKVSATAVTDGTVSETGGTIALGNVQDANAVEWGTAITLTANAKEGYEFEGWYTDSACTKAYATDNTANPLGITVKSDVTVYAKFVEKTDSTTTIYFETRSGFNSYYAFVYSDVGANYSGNWPGAKATYDNETGYYKYEFTTPDTGNFRVIVSDNGNNQYPAGGQSGLEGTIGKTYLFKSSNKLEEYTPTPIAPVSIKFVDKTDNKWIANDTPKMRLVLPDGTYRDLSSTKGQTEWVWDDIPGRFTSFTVKRMKSDGTAEWNSWNTGERNLSTTYEATGSGSGSWK